MVALQCLSAVAVMVAAVAASEPSQPAPSTALDQFRVTVALPGTGVSAMTRAQAARMARQVNGCLTGNPRDASSLERFESLVYCLRRTPAACVLRADSRSRTVNGVCRELGVVVRQEQELDRCGSRPEVVACLRRLAEARRTGASEDQVRAMAREGLARGELSPGTQAERRAVRQRLDDLTREMVKAVRQVAFAVQGSGAARAGRDEYSR